VKYQAAIPPFELHTSNVLRNALRRHYKQANAKPSRVVRIDRPTELTRAADSITMPRDEKDDRLTALSPQEGKTS
jgi:hypothetical protein